jgi:hypothetical protein
MMRHDKEGPTKHEHTLALNFEDLGTADSEEVVVGRSTKTSLEFSSSIDCLQNCRNDRENRAPEMKATTASFETKEDCPVKNGNT